MKKILLSLLIAAASHHGYAQHAIPDYRTVISRLYDLYDLDDVYIQVAKTKGGYEIAQYDFDLQRYGGRQLFWSRATGAYKELSGYTPGRSSEQAAINALSDPYIYLFNLYPYYGYVGWETDVIDTLSKVPDPSEEMLYLLGRAHSSLSQSRFNDNYGFADSSQFYSYAESGRNLFSKEQLDFFINHNDTAHAYFKQLQRRNPQYITRIGGIGMKANNELMYKYTVLQVYQNDTIAYNEIKDVTYNYTQLDFAKRILSACAPDAILFTYGDNDYYATLYVQQVLNFRKDVNILNISWLNLANYVNFIRDHKWYKGRQIRMTLSEQDYAGKKLQLIRVDRPEDVPYSITAAAFLERVKANDEGRMTLNERFVRLPLAKGREIVAPLEKNYYQSGLATLDIIASNAERPIYFTSVNEIGLDRYVQQEGAVCRLADTSYYDEKVMTSFLNSLDYAQLKKDKEYALHPSYPPLIVRAYANQIVVSDLQNLQDKKLQYVNRFLDLVPGSLFNVNNDFVNMIRSVDYGTHAALYDRLLSRLISDASLCLDIQGMEYQDVQRITETVNDVIRNAETKNEKIIQQLKELQKQLQTKKAI